MKLEQLQARLRELEVAITNTTNNVYVMQGHKQELEYQISELLKPQLDVNPDATPVDETKIEQPAVNSDESPVV